jgi:hypothetical protein
VSPGVDGNDTFAIASIFSSNVRNCSPDGDVRIGGIALGCGLELIDFHTILDRLPVEIVPSTHVWTSVLAEAIDSLPV